MIGTILKNRYCVMERMNTGGTGQIYLARDMELGVYWAVKEIPIAGKKEAKLLRLLDHPSLPRMVDYVETDEYCYLVMEYIRGESFGALLRKGKRFRTEEILQYGIETSKILDYLHSQKPPVFYGDLKPDNLILAQSGRVYLVDLGSAALGYSDIQKVCTGTKGFAAPEQYRNELTASSDIFAFGKTLLALMGKRLWCIGGRHPQLLYIIGRCCLQNPKKRYNNVKQVSQRLEGILRKKGRNPFGVLGISVGTAVLLLVIGGVLLYMERIPEFPQALTEVTEVYFDREFREGSAKQRRKICEKAEKQLQKLLKTYPEKEAQKRILLLLAANEEYGSKEGKPEVYYEQLLMYDSGCGEAYGEYGMYLLRRGKRRQAEKLWNRYQEKEETGGLEKEEGGNLELWEEAMNEAT